MTKKLKATTCTTSEFAAFINRSMRWVQKMIREGQIPRTDKDGKMQTWPAVHAYISSLQDALKTGGAESNEITAARGRLELARAEAAEIEVAKMKGELVMADDVMGEWMHMASNFRARILSAGSVIAAQGANMERAELLVLVQNIHETALKELSYGELENESDIPANSEPEEVKTNVKGSGGKRKTTTKTDSK